ncbi:MAG: redoxin domain-containing protein [Rhodospirillales bacterium]|nr:redoxin domain-containing protein [Rhodospirillales bacterium]
MTRRSVLAAGTLAATLVPGKPRAAEPAGLPALHVVTPPKPLPAVKFRDAAGKIQTLAAYRGRGVVLNLWATWCAPCVRELPSLDALAGQLKGGHIAVLTVSADIGGVKTVREFYAKHHIDNLPVLVDPEGDVLHALGARGLPTTYLVTPAGTEAGWIEGGQDWSAPASLARIKALIGG